MYNFMWWALVIMLGVSQLTKLAELMGVVVKTKPIGEYEPGVRFVMFLFAVPFWYYAWLIFLNARH